MLHRYFLFFFNDTATTEIYTLSLHDALPISPDHRNPYRASRVQLHPGNAERLHADGGGGPVCGCGGASGAPGDSRVKGLHGGGRSEPRTRRRDCCEPLFLLLVCLLPPASFRLLV